jgi:glutathione-regulated potassium-efflux system ancillary protein KefC
LFALAKSFQLANSQNIIFSFALSQGGEFAFVLFSIASSESIISPQQSSLLMMVVAISMACTPLLMIVNERLVQPRFNNTTIAEPDHIEDENNPVIIAGFGRYGQIVGRLLHAHNIGTTVLDHDPKHIEMIRKHGYKVYYGDTHRIDLLEAAGAATAKVIVIAIDDRDAVIKLIQLVQQHFPHLKVFARAYDMLDIYKMMDLKIDGYSRETFNSALELGEMALTHLGFSAYEARKSAQAFVRHDKAVIERIHPVHKDEHQRISLTREVRQELEKLLDADERVVKSGEDASWG